jgi:hypothetical protein
MPTVRIPINRATHPRITPQARQVFARAVALQPIYLACKCSSAARANERCSACREFLALRGELDRLLGQMPWDRSPLDTRSANPPDHVAKDALQAERWRKAWALRRQLQE